MRQIRPQAKLLTALGAAAFFSGCATMPRPSDNYRPTLPPAYSAVQPDNGSI
jgi:PBP1b-binding outer membrane lipoprotein LpoB